MWKDHHQQTHYSMAEPHCSNFMIITGVFQVSEYLENLQFLVLERCFQLQG